LIKKKKFLFFTSVQCVISRVYTAHKDIWAVIKWNISNNPTSYFLIMCIIMWSRGLRKLILVCHYYCFCVLPTKSTAEWIFMKFYTWDILLKFGNMSQLWARCMKICVLFCMHHNCNLLSTCCSQIFNKSCRGKFNIYYGQYTFLGSLLGFEIMEQKWGNCQNNDVRPFPKCFEVGVTQTRKWQRLKYFSCVQLIWTENLFAFMPCALLYSQPTATNMCAILQAGGKCSSVAWHCVHSNAYFALKL
jgi:hypothetical protein